jgi:hypothetical protein
MNIDEIDKIKNSKNENVINENNKNEKIIIKKSLNYSRINKIIKKIKVPKEDYEPNHFKIIKLIFIHCHHKAKRTFRMFINNFDI